MSSRGVVFRTEQHRLVFLGHGEGKIPRIISKELGIPTTTIERIIDKYKPFIVRNLKKYKNGFK